MRIPRLVLALYPNARGFAYVIFEGPTSPVDWGISEVLHRDGRLKTCMKRLAALFDRYCPDVLVLRAAGAAGAASLTAIIDAAEAFARGRGIETHRLSRKEIQHAFAFLSCCSRYAIAVRIAQKLPMLGLLLPAPRKIWNGEDRRMGLFDAAALAVTFFAFNENTAAPVNENGN
jgi:hypothetical protein